MKRFIPQAFLSIVLPVAAGIALLPVSAAHGQSASSTVSSGQGALLYKHAGSPRPEGFPAGPRGVKTSITGVISRDKLPGSWAKVITPTGKRKYIVVHFEENDPLTAALDKFEEARTPVTVTGMLQTYGDRTQSFDSFNPLTIHATPPAAAKFPMSATVPPVPASSLQAVGASVNLTPVFSGMEKDCGEENPKFQAAMAWLTTQSKKAPNVAKAAKELRDGIAGGVIKVDDGGEFWTITAPTLNASYRGVPLAAIERVAGKENGISIFTLVFTDSRAVVAKAFGKVGTNGKADMDSVIEPTLPQLLAQEKTGRGMLMCAFSN